MDNDNVTEYDACYDESLNRNGNHYSGWLRWNHWNGWDIRQNNHERWFLDRWQQSNGWKWR
jgi:hypothetical protein